MLVYGQCFGVRWCFFADRRAGLNKSNASECGLFKDSVVIEVCRIEFEVECEGALLRVSEAGCVFGHVAPP